MQKMCNDECPFCNLPRERVFHEGHLFKAAWDIFPVSTGHALLIPNRHVATWFDASPEEQIDLVGGIARVCRTIDRLHSPDGYNIGINVGEAAGQTVFHLHIHVIPRYRNDTIDPTGGVRNVIAGRGKYPIAGREWAGAASARHP